MKKITILIMLAFAVAVSAQESKGLPKWVDDPQKYGIREYAKGWIYEAVPSHKCATESLAKSRVRLIVQSETAANIANNISAAFLWKELSIFEGSGIDDPAQMINRVILSDIITKVPGYEALLWHTVKDKEKGKDFYIAYVFVRFKLSDILGALDKVDPDKILNDLIKDGTLNEESISDQARKEFLDMFRKQIIEEQKRRSEAAN